MGTGGFPSQDVSCQAITNHHCFLGLAMQLAHRLLRERRLRLPDNLWRDSTACFNSGHHSATTRYIAVRDGQECITIDGNKLRALTDSDYSSGQLLIVEMTIQAYQYYVGLKCVEGSNLQVMLPYQVNQGRLAYNIDEGH